MVFALRSGNLLLKIIADCSEICPILTSLRCYDHYLEEMYHSHEEWTVWYTAESHSGNEEISSIQHIGSGLFLSDWFIVPLISLQSQISLWEDHNVFQHLCTVPVIQYWNDSNALIMGSEKRFFMDISGKPLFNFP